MQELSGGGIDLHDALDHFVPGRDSITERQQQEERREERHQTEIAHRCGGREQIVVVELVDCFSEHTPPGRAIANAE